MKIVIDTNSLLSFVRYYLPFDENGVFKNFIESQIKGGNILILDKVLDECKYVSNGVIIKELVFLHKYKINSTTLLPNKKFFNQLENNFVNGVIKNKLNDAEFEKAKGDYLESADAKLLLYCQKYKEENLIIVSEETNNNNDNKVFKKLPAICTLLQLEIMTFPQYLNKIEKMEINFHKV